MARPGLSISLEMTGDGQLLKSLSGSKVPGVKNLAKRRFVRFAAEVREDMRRGAPKETGRLKKAVKSRSTRSGGAQVFVDKSRAPHWYVSGEGGTKQRKTKKGANRGHVNQRPWIEPARKRAKARFHTDVVRPALDEIKALLISGVK